MLTSTPTLSFIPIESTWFTPRNSQIRKCHEWHEMARVHFCRAVLKSISVSSLLFLENKKIRKMHLFAFTYYECQPSLLPISLLACGISRRKKK